MARQDIAAVILAAGMGTRMKSALPKVLHPLAGRPLIGHVLDTVADLGAVHQIVVVGPDMPEVAKAVAPARTVVQQQQNGTADAVKAARPELNVFDGTVLVLFGDTPLISAGTLEAMIALRTEARDTAVVVLGFRPEDPGAYGRLVMGRDGTLDAIVEARDATPDQLRIDLCNSGVMAVDGSVLFELVDSVGDENAKGEFYLTDIVSIARGRGLSCRYLEASEEELLGVNDRIDLAHAEAVIQDRLRRAAMAEGVTMTAPETVFLSFDTRFGRDVSIGTNVVFGPGVTVEDGARIRDFSHIEGTHVGRDALVGPFARLRPGTRLEEGARVGNFVEAKNAVIGAGAKANHLSYVGDAEVGAYANIGAGTITCNYDGYLKHRTVIGEGAFIGSNTALVAPVRIGRGGIVGAGSTITRDVADDALAVARGEQNEVPGAARKIRDRKTAEKARAAGK